MRICVAGSRDYPDKPQVRAWLEKHVSTFGFDTIISGLAKGPDTWAKEWAEEYGIPVMAFPADWEGLGRGAGYVRNVEMVKAANLVVCFWDGKSKGTKHTIDTAVAKGVPLIVLAPYPNEDASYG